MRGFVSAQNVGTESHWLKKEEKRKAVINMFRRGRGWHRGYGSWRQAAPTVSEGYAYVGPCRCGLGPHAFYQDKSGRIVHASQAHRWVTPPTLAREDLEADANWLKSEGAELEKRIRELEERLRREE